MRNFFPRKKGGYLKLKKNTEFEIGFGEWMGVGKKIEHLFIFIFLFPTPPPQIKKVLSTF